jgi:oxygen-independent coproporphyrinogen-3 oxidase
MPPNGSEPAAAPKAVAPLGIYAHFPFCSVRCTYCDFPTVAGQDGRIAAYLDALAAEIETFQPEAQGAADTIFFGGGTPSRMSPGQAARVLAAIRARFDVAEGAEVTLEGNPESLDRRSLAGFREAGITRISVGMQSLSDAVLKGAGRAHDARQALDAIQEAREAGFGRVSLDLIAGLPGEDLAAWPDTVRRAAAAAPDHVSVYLLESDKDTPLGRAVRSGRLVVAGDDAMAATYEQTVTVLEREGFPLYEISNFAAPGRRSLHNLKYWTDAPYAGFGLGAHAYVLGKRRANRRDLDGYIADVAAGKDPLDWEEPYDRDRRLEEALFLGLRVVEGVDLVELGARYGADLRARHAEAWDRGTEAGLIVWDGERVRLTPSGRVRSNELFSELIGNAA